MSGAVVSRAGAPAQDFHRDGERPGLVNVFVPLVDVAADADGPQFWPRSHRFALEGEACLRLEGSALESQLRAPACAAGGLLCFDYRVYHRGLPNRAGRDRAVAYFVFATEPGAQDTENFPGQSVFDALPVHAESIPFWTDY